MKIYTLEFQLKRKRVSASFYRGLPRREGSFRIYENDFGRPPEPDDTFGSLSWKVGKISRARDMRLSLEINTGPVRSYRMTEETDETTEGVLVLVTSKSDVVNGIVCVGDVEQSIAELVTNGMSDKGYGEYLLAAGNDPGLLVYLPTLEKAGVCVLLAEGILDEPEMVVRLEEPPQYGKIPLAILPIDRDWRKKR